MGCAQSLLVKFSDNLWIIEDYEEEALNKLASEHQKRVYMSQA